MDNNNSNKNEQGDTQKTNSIEDMYKNLSYFDQYSSSVVLFFLVTIIFFTLTSYFFVMINIEPIKDDWVNQRCNPYVIPFAGLINRPPGKGIREFTQENFDYCTQTVLQGVTGEAVQPLTFVTLAITKVFEMIERSINNIREVFARIRTSVRNVAEELMGRLMNIMTPIVQVIIALRDMLSRSQGVMTAGLYTLLGSYYTLNSLMGAIAQFIVTILIALAALIAVLWIFPFTWGAAAANTAIFIAISIPFALILAFMTRVLRVGTGLSIPRIRCFDKDTPLVMNNGTVKTIRDIKVGDVLMNNNKISSKIKVTREGLKMYNLDGVVVSESHLVFYKTNWIRVSEHPRAFIILDYKEPYLYCLNTTSKLIIIKGNIFSDWDEIVDQSKTDYLKNTVLNEKGIYNYTQKDFHRFLNGGFYEKTQVEMQNGHKKDICNINVGDMLKGGYNNYVYGIVEIDGYDLSEMCEYDLGNKSFVGGPNINIFDDENRIIRTFYIKENDKLVKNPYLLHEKKLYHLLTTNKYFYVNNSIKSLDYNSLVDLFFQK